MGNPKFPRKKYNTPLHPWKEERIKSERELLKKYGLKNHKEVWKAKTYLGKYRHQARELLAKIGTKDPQITHESDQLLVYLTRMGILPMGSSLDDVLALEIESVLSRRLQTLVYLKGLASTPDHSRQLITHGHIAIGNRKVTIPSYMVIKDEEVDISYTGRSPLNELSHPARPKTDVLKGAAAVLTDETATTPATKKPTTQQPKQDKQRPTEKPSDKEQQPKEQSENKKPDGQAPKDEKTEEPSSPQPETGKPEEAAKEVPVEEPKQDESTTTPAEEKQPEESPKDNKPTDQPPAQESKSEEPASKSTDDSPSKSPKEEKPKKEGGD